MTYRNTSFGYGSISKFLHWTIFILVTIMLLYGYLMGYASSTWKSPVYNIHKLTGLLILVLMICRLCWALSNPKPKLPVTTPSWEIIAERFVHYFFYLILLAMPLAGLTMSSAAGKAPRLFGITLALPIAKDKFVATIAGDIHNILAIVIIVTICLHVLAALKHHFINKDNILVRMMPVKSEKKPDPL